jgi:hypothetical protein
MNLYEWEWDCGRQGSVGGRFFATPDSLERIFGKEIYFGEILGKHSEVVGRLERDEVKLVTDNQEFIAKAKELSVNLESGYNPFDYYEGDDIDQSEDDERISLEEYLNDLEHDRDE